MAVKSKSRRQFLKFILSSLSVVGALFAFWPFIKSMQPGKKAQSAAAPITVDIKNLLPNEKITVTWQGMPIYVIRRTQSQINELEVKDPYLRDPNSLYSKQPENTDNDFRSINKDIFVVVAICTHLGCSPTYKPELGSVDKTWEGGFFCACHGSKFDLAGRVYKKVPAPTNLMVPPYYFPDANTIVIGAEKPGDKSYV
ncbi:MAG: ubiquinol-cytochrome c reductase iron-sulfur subunit [Pseudomonadota bacterium]|nr:ubiquinol-cytochrome c reductase iron-sulfur subunit [Pseudomonadota bacterium]